MSWVYSTDYGGDDWIPMSVIINNLKRLGVDRVQMFVNKTQEVPRARSR